MQLNLVKDRPLVDSCWDKKKSFHKGGVVVSMNIMCVSHFWLLICSYILVHLQANTYEELPEQVIGAARLAHVEPSTAVVPDLENNSDLNKDNSSNDVTSSEDDSSKKTNWLGQFCEEEIALFFFFFLAPLVLNHCTN